MIQSKLMMWILFFIFVFFFIWTAALLCNYLEALVIFFLFAIEIVDIFPHSQNYNSVSRFAIFVRTF